jgi:hypothetical protein
MFICLSPGGQSLTAGETTGGRHHLDAQDGTLSARGQRRDSMGLEEHRV